jgi:hypothetical protein
MPTDCVRYERRAGYRTVNGTTNIVVTSMGALEGKTGGLLFEFAVHMQPSKIEAVFYNEAWSVDAT